ncbi:MAG: HU family DNA-binding protein [Proteobacteria bacterium]|nr:HU family DNA-binding protein [Pseudomonadota bacterium]MBS0573926.1 HU family DNA-binding protein [Pseudomonadota bacterium]
MTKEPTAATARPAGARKPAGTRAAPAKAGAVKAGAVKAAPAKAGAVKAAPAEAGAVKAGAAKSGSAKAAAADRPVLKLKELLDRVAARADVRKKDAKPVVEALLAVLGDALAAGESLILPPLGRVRVNRTKDAANGAMLTIKLKRGGGGKKARDDSEDDLAEPPE